MKHYFDTFSTPAGMFSVALDEDGDLVASAFGDAKRLATRFDADQIVHDSKRASRVRIELAEFFLGKRRHFTIRFAPAGSQFQHRVWDALVRIPYGETRSYGELAVQLGNPAASRAVGRAVATNPICLLVPCHRVIGSDGSLTGFAFGVELKRRLLELEGALPGSPPVPSGIAWRASP